MKSLRLLSGLALGFLLLFPAVSEGKKKKNYQDQEVGEESSSKQRAVQNSLDLSGYGVIDEIRRINLQTKLKQMIMRHNRNHAERRTKVKNVRFKSSTVDLKAGKLKYENFNYLDLGGYGFINEVDQKDLENRLNEMIEQHNLYAKGKLKRQGIRFRNN